MLSVGSSESLLCHFSVRQAENSLVSKVRYKSFIHPESGSPVFTLCVDIFNFYKYNFCLDTLILLGSFKCGLNLINIKALNQRACKYICSYVPKGHDLNASS